MRKCLFIFTFVVFSHSGFAATINVTTFGAVGDEASTTANCTASATITTAATLSSSDIGKAIEIFGAGPLGSGATNYQDNIATITGVSGGTTVTISRSCSHVTNGALVIWGTCNSTNVQAAYNSANAGDVVLFPSGRYLMLSTNLLDPAFADTGPFQIIQAVALTNNAVTIAGASQSGTVLIGCGAFRLYPDVIRGEIFDEMSPVGHQGGSMVFSNLTLDGGLLNGRQSYSGFPANNSGDGWDVTHDAVCNTQGGGVFFTNHVFVNVTVQHWRGEMIKSAADFQAPGTTAITNCLFMDGNATALNWMLGGHTVTGCTFSNLIEVEEFSQGQCLLPCLFISNVATNCLEGIAISGAYLTRLPQAAYTIASNQFYLQGGYGVNLTPAENVYVLSNYFNTASEPVLSGGAGEQGNAPISNIVVNLNFATNCGQFIIAYDGGYIGLTNNTCYAIPNQNSPFMSGGNSETIGFTYLVGNTAFNCVNGCQMSPATSGLPYDDLSNAFPYHQYDDFSGQVNLLTYQWGARHNIHTTQASSLWQLDDTIPNQIPAAAVVVVTNETSSFVPIYLSASKPAVCNYLHPSEQRVFNWTGSSWTPAVPQARVRAQ